jgi:AcrR family transcriptional regulator
MADRAAGAGHGTKAYHHGDLRRALIEAGEQLLAEKGVEGFSLRECARRAGVSPAAPAHHFGNVAGLLTAIATLGFEGLSDAMEAGAAAAGPAPADRLGGIAAGYIRFALAHPARFRLIFGRLQLDHADPALAAAAQRAFGILSDTILAQPQHAGRLDADAEADLVLAWSSVHGFANLALDGRMPFVDGPDRDRRVAAMAERVVAIMLRRG